MTDSMADLTMEQRNQALTAWLNDLTTVYEKCAAERDALRDALRQLLASYENYASEHKPEAEWDEYDMTIFPLWRAARALLEARP